MRRTPRNEPRRRRARPFLLETPDAARQRQADILASLLGWGLCADGYHPTSPDPEATYLRQAILDCLHDARVQAEEIDWINAHGTGTRENDATEAKAFAHIAPKVPVSSLKRLYGHTMGAAAAIEAVASVLALQHQERYQSVGCEGLSPINGLSLQTAHESCEIRHVLSTSLAFGGMNAALLFGKGRRMFLVQHAAAQHLDLSQRPHGSAPVINAEWTP